MRVCVLCALFIVAITLTSSIEAKPLKPSSDAGFTASSSLRYTLVRVLPHARNHFTQGLEIDGDLLLESTGGYGVSALIAQQPGYIEAFRERSLPDTVFGEGLTVFGNAIYQLTWREQRAFVWNRDFELLRVIPYEGEGWGLAHDDTQLIMSDGSARLSFRRADDFAVTRTITVRDGTTPIERLNELEYAHGLIFANVWQTDRIAVIDPADGAVLAWLDLRELRQSLPPVTTAPAIDVLNGIAYDAARDSFYVTGKHWPRLFELKLDHLPLPRALRSSASPSGERPPSPAR